MNEYTSYGKQLPSDISASRGSDIFWRAYYELLALKNLSFEEKWQAVREVERRTAQALHARSSYDALPYHRPPWKACSLTAPHVQGGLRLVGK